MPFAYKPLSEQNVTTFRNSNVNRIGKWKMDSLQTEQSIKHKSFQTNQYVVMEKAVHGHFTACACLYMYTYATRIHCLMNKDQSLSEQMLKMRKSNGSHDKPTV